MVTELYLLLNGSCSSHTVTLNLTLKQQGQYVGDRNIGKNDHQGLSTALHKDTLHES